MDCSFPEVHFPSWWDINTHRGNHLCQLPVHQHPYSNGRGMVADWGRTGACHIVDDEKVDVYEQITCGLAGNAHPSPYPKSLLPPNYHLQKSYKAHPMSSRSHGILWDPVIGEQASAAFIVSKLFTILRQNMPTSRRKRAFETSEKVQEFVQFLAASSEELMSAGLFDDSKLSKILEAIANRIVPIKKDRSVRTSNAVDLTSLPSTRRTRAISHFRDMPSNDRVLTHIFSLPQNDNEIDMLREYFCLTADKATDCSQIFPNDLVTAYLCKKEHSICSLSDMACGIDPFLITIAGRRVNPTFLGGGCLKISKDYNIHTTPIMCWAPPNPIGVNSPPCIYSSLLRQSSLCDWDAFVAFQLPEQYASSSICELEVSRIDEFTVYMVARTTSGRVYTGTASFDDVDDGDRKQWLLSSAEVLEAPHFVYRPVSIALSPWSQHVRGSENLRCLDWAVVGRHCDQSSSIHLAAVSLYDAATNQRLWAGQIALDSPGECITSETAASMIASFPNISKIDRHSDDFANHVVFADLLDYCGQVEKPAAQARSPNHLLRQAELDMELSHASNWLRVGFGSCPGELTLATPNRLLVLDTRTRSGPVSELFNLTTSVKWPLVGHGRIFNPTECLFHSPATWLNDVYALVATDYNGLLLDKRMPGYPVLHWSHALRGPLTFADWYHVDARRGETPAEAMLVSASQYPAEVSATGFNFSSSTSETLPPQIVGPSVAGADLSDLLRRVPQSLPGRLLSPNLSSSRLTTCIVGLASCALPDAQGVRGIYLTTAGDIFAQDWQFSPSVDSSAIEVDEKTSSWLYYFRNRGYRKCMSRQGEDDDLVETVLYQSEPSAKCSNTHVNNCINLLEQEEAYPNFVTLAQKSGVEFMSELYADIESIVKGEEIVPDFLSAERTLEESKRQAYLDSLALRASKYRSRDFPTLDQPSST